MFNKQKYKTYDSSHGFGNSSQWEAIFKALFGDIDPEELLKEAYNRLDDKTKEKANNAANNIRKEYNESLKFCKTKEELKSKFRSLMMKYHPDKAGDTKENNEKCKNIILEYEKQLKKLKK